MAEKFYNALTRIKTNKGEWIAPPALRPTLVRDAREHNTSMNEMATKVLADSFGYPYEIRERGSTTATEGEVLNLRLPTGLIRKMRVRHPDTVPDVVRRTLAAHYGLAMPPKPSRKRSAVT